MSLMEIGQLAAASGVTRRTIRYYVAIGLLPPGEGTGPRRLFSRSHLDRLVVIRQLKDQFLPLDEIKRRLSGWSEQEIAEKAQPEAPCPAPPEILCEPPLKMRFSAPIAPRAASHRYFPDRDTEKRPGDRRDEEPKASSWTRLELAPGLELFLRENASPSARDLYNRVRHYVRSSSSSGYREPEVNDHPGDTYER